MERLRHILSNVLDVKEGQINDETSPDNVDTWDSLAGLTLVTELESQFNVKFSMDEVMSVKCVGDIRALLIKHGVTLKE